MNWSIIFVPACLLVMYILHANGYLITQSKRALTFMGDGLGMKKRMGFSFSRCSGWVSRVLKIREDGIYRFDLDGDLSAGAVQFQVLNKGKLPLLTLDSDTPRGRLQLETKQRYYVKMQFFHASGDCRATWEKE